MAQYVLCFDGDWLIHIWEKDAYDGCFVTSIYYIIVNTVSIKSCFKMIIYPKSWYLLHDASTSRVNG